MTSFIKLSGTEGSGYEYVWVRPELIDHIHHDLLGRTRVVMTGGTSYLVQDQPEQLLRRAYPSKAF